ncbi:N-acetylmuramoyl-L-alanine amidase [Bradyrhizobium sp. STM 3809]|uniref:peptidoglycan recognition protein family protein n=1 Tax=Bradyrhizobium sp. STM 3809 TaxID=551936 RepID=UPI0002408CD6|nr:N-acetylmuramoyl-L-alanine amidase [Bradyrhizobium sp. STM 3809]CCE00062.1 Peptidoglycan-binding domain 1 protein (modular protein) [Bradyrhizobium sp. STM 3809]
MVFSLTWLAEVLEDAGLKVAEQPGWRSRGRAEMGTVKGVICHHTAGPGPDKGVMPSLGIITNGRPDLAGPLAQLGLGRDGTYFIVAAGRCNHAGVGMWQGLRNGNENFIGIEAENSGTANDPWPAVQLDAYRRGVAAILKKINADPVMCCGHKEYALPPGRKDDPTFDMNEFRSQVAAILAGTAPAPIIIPSIDEEKRPTLRRGARGDLVRQLQNDLRIEKIDGIFGAGTEAALREFQRQHNMVPDGIAGPKTWAALDASPGPALPPSPPPANAPDIQMLAARAAGPSSIDELKQMAANSPVTRINWRDRGAAPKGYVVGMALTFGRVYHKFKSGDAAALDMARKSSGNVNRDALAWYNDIFTAAGMSNAADGAETLRHLFVLMFGLGMRESSGHYCEGRDVTADNMTADTAEAGLFQMSFDANRASPLLGQIFARYKASPSGFLADFSVGVHCSSGNLENFGSGDGLDFQRLCKQCPAFAVEYAAVALRHIRKHWGPINRKKAEIRAECDALLAQVATAIDSNPALGPALQ